MTSQNQNIITGLIERINYHILLHLFEICSLISPEHYLECLKMIDFNENDIRVIKNTPTNERFDIMMKTLNEKTHNTCRTIEDVQKYYDDKLHSKYKDIMLKNLKDYEIDDTYYEILTRRMQIQ